MIFTVRYSCIVLCGFDVCQSVRLSFHFGPDRNFSIALDRTAMNLCPDIHDHQRMNPFVVLNDIKFGPCSAHPADLSEIEQDTGLLPFINMTQLMM